MIAFAIVLLPQPDSPASPTISPAPIVEVDAVDGADARARRVLDDEARELDERSRRCGASVDAGRRQRRVDHARRLRRRRAAQQRRATARASRRAAAGCEISSMPGEDEDVSPSTVITSASPGKKNGHHSPWSTAEFACAQ